MQSNAASIPWHRQFWPWFLIALPACTVVAGITTVFISIKHADSLVVDNYYKEGLAINSRLDKKNLADTLGLSASIHIEQEAGSLILALHSSEQAHYPDMLLLKLTHPFDAKKDKEIPLKSTAESGIYSQSLPQEQLELITGSWHASITPLYLRDASASELWQLDMQLSLPLHSAQKSLPNSSRYQHVNIPVS